jgi:hypothetical protein
LPKVVRSLTERLEILHTQKQGNWLNIAKIELSALTRQCLDSRIGTLPSLCLELSEWENVRNKNQNNVDWQLKQTT